MMISYKLQNNWGNYKLYRGFAEYKNDYNISLTQCCTKHKMQLLWHTVPPNPELPNTPLSFFANGCFPPTYLCYSAIYLFSSSSQYKWRNVVKVKAELCWGNMRPCEWLNFDDFLFSLLLLFLVGHVAWYIFLKQNIAANSIST